MNTNQERKRLGEILTKEFNKRNLTIYKLEKETGLQGSQIEHIFKGLKNYTVDSLILVSEALGLKIFK